GVAALRQALLAPGRSLVVASDIRGGLPGSSDERSSGDAASALLCGDAPELAAELLGSASASAEFLDRWRQPGAPSSGVWEERFSEGIYAELGDEAWTAAIKSAGVDEAEITTVGIA